MITILINKTDTITYDDSYNEVNDGDIMMPMIFQLS